MTRGELAEMRALAAQVLRHGPDLERLARLALEVELKAREGDPYSLPFADTRPPKDVRRALRRLGRAS